MKRDYKYFKDEEDKKIGITSMKRYLAQKQELDKFLEVLIRTYIEGRQFKILDACCGIGHILHFLHAISPNSTFLGIDKEEALIKEARQARKELKNIAFEIADIYDIPMKYPKYFDITINWKTISWLPYYDELLKACIAVTKKHIFLSSLFYEGNVDFDVRVRRWGSSTTTEDFNFYQNVYSLPHFKEVAFGLGVKNIEVYDFEIDLDISRPPPDQIRTYTLGLADGKRLQVSGVVLMSWKVIRLDL